MGLVPDPHPAAPFGAARAAALAKGRARVWLMGGAALILVLGVYWYVNNSGSETARPSNAAPVRVAKIERRDMAVIEHSLGTIIANTTVQVTARVQGTLDKANFREGQFVKKGDLLFQIDPRPFQAALAQAEAIWRRDQAQLQNALRDKARYASLSAQGAISSQQRDTSATNADVMDATVAADKAALDMARLNLDYAQIRSPVDGKTGPVLIQPGNMVSANGAAPLVTISEVRPVKISFTLPQSDLARIQARQKNGQMVAILDAMDAGGRPLSAPIDFVSNAVSGQSGTIELRATFANTDLSLVPGQLANVTVQMNDLKDALVIPRDGVNDSPNGSFVFVVKDGKAAQVPVTVLFDDGANAAISGDVAPGDDVIVEGQLRVVPDGKVRILDAHGARQAGGARRGGPKKAAP
jgi:multidrug efflux system membrane fusion protein